MKDNPYNVINTISASSLSRCQKWVLTTLYAQAGEGSCTICLNSLSQLTSTSTRHLFRIISQLSALGVVKIIRRPGRCNTYLLPVALVLRADGSLSPSGEATVPHNTPSPSGKKQKIINFKHNQDLILAWEKSFQTKYQPVCEKEQNAMDYMLWANLNNKIGKINLPIAYLQTLIKNGHATDFIPFSKRQKKIQKQKVIQKTRSLKKIKKEKQKDGLWLVYTKLNATKQNSIKNDFEKNEIKKNQPKIVQDIYSRDGFQNQMILALYKNYVINNISQGAKK